MPASHRSRFRRWTRPDAFGRLSRVRGPLIKSRLFAFASVVAFAIVAAGCGSAPSPGSAQPPPAPPAPMNEGEYTATAHDSTGSIPGEATAAFVYRFRQTEPASGSAFSFRDRDLTFSFRPSPNALFFTVENLQGRPVQIDWDRSVFVEPNGRAGKVGHNTTRWRDRFTSQPFSQVLPQQRFSDYVFAIDDLIDPGANPETQLRRKLLPEDSSALTYAGRTFGVDLVFTVENQPRTYTFRFQVQSVIPR